MAQYRLHAKKLIPYIYLFQFVSHSSVNMLFPSIRVNWTQVRESSFFACLMENAYLHYTYHQVLFASECLCVNYMQIGHAHNKYVWSLALTYFINTLLQLRILQLICISVLNRNWMRKKLSIFYKDTKNNILSVKPTNITHYTAFCKWRDLFQIGCCRKTN